MSHQGKWSLRFPTKKTHVDLLVFELVARKEILITRILLKFLPILLHLNKYKIKRNNINIKDIYLCPILVFVYTHLIYHFESYSKFSTLNWLNPQLIHFQTTTMLTSNIHHFLTKNLNVRFNYISKRALDEIEKAHGKSAMQRALMYTKQAKHIAKEGFLSFKNDLEQYFKLIMIEKVDNKPLTP